MKLTPERLDAEVVASMVAAPVIAAGDEKTTSIEAAKAAGFFPAGYQLPPCPVQRAVSEGDLITVGELTLQVWETPGHAEGHLSFWMQGSDRTYLIGADLVFFGGKILLQNTHDCSISAYGRSVAKVAALDFDALLPGHQQISLSEGKRHVEQALALVEDACGAGAGAGRRGIGVHNRRRIGGHC